MKYVIFPDLKNKYIKFKAYFNISNMKLKKGSILDIFFF